MSHIASQARGEVTGSGYLNNSGLEARADREGALAASGGQVYGGPMMDAPSFSAAAPMQAQDDDDEEEIPQEEEIPEDPGPEPKPPVKPADYDTPPENTAYKDKDIPGFDAEMANRHWLKGPFAEWQDRHDAYDEAKEKYKENSKKWKEKNTRWNNYQAKLTKQAELAEQQERAKKKKEERRQQAKLDREIREAEEKADVNGPVTPEFRKQMSAGAKEQGLRRAKLDETLKKNSELRSGGPGAYGVDTKVSAKVKAKSDELYKKGIHNPKKTSNKGNQQGATELNQSTKPQMSKEQQKSFLDRMSKPKNPVEKTHKPNRRWGPK